MRRRIISAGIGLLVLGWIHGCKSAQDDISFNYHIINGGKTPIGEAIELSGPSAAETQLNRVDERIENAFY